MNDDAIAPVSDDEFKRAQRIMDARERRELEKKMRAKPLEKLIEGFTGKVEPDPSAPLGKCEKCGVAYEASDTGRLKDHVCAKIVAQIAATQLSAEERIAERAVDRHARFNVHRTRRDSDED